MESKTITHLIIILILLFQWVRPLPLLAAQNFGTPDFEVLFHPDGWLEVGDPVSIEIYSKLGQNLNDQELKVNLEPDGALLGTARFEPAADGQSRALLLWAWDTSSLAPGAYTLDFSITPQATTWQERVELRPPASLKQEWRTVETDCCRVHYITGTPAERDLDQLLAIINQQAQLVVQELGHPLEQKIDLDLIPRVLGQGGFSGQEIYFSYPQVNYIATDLATVLHHELVHNIEGEISADLRPLFFMEGLAVYLTGGHYKPEPVLVQAAALPGLGLYIPLRNLSADFYSWQHEAGYLEAAALVAYMVNTWGRDGFDHFYRNIHPTSTGGDPQAISQALSDNFGITLDTLDDRFQRYLEQIPAVPDLRDDVAFSVDYYEAIRTYQQKLDPSAYFRQVWLPDVAEMRKRGITADFTRRLETGQMSQIEQLLANAGADWRIGQLAAARQELSNALGLINK